LTEVELVELSKLDKVVDDAEGESVALTESDGADEVADAEADVLGTEDAGTAF
jgi:hypothetical protein